ncbi:MAG: M3 family metallopeptidase [Pseudomonadota bacterium]
MRQFDALYYLALAVFIKLCYVPVQVVINGVVLLILMIVAGAASAGEASDPGLRFDLTAPQIRTECRDRLQDTTHRLDVLASTTSGPTFRATIAEFEGIRAESDQALAAHVYLKDIATDASVRDSSKECYKEVQDFWTDVYARSDLYSRLKTYASSMNPFFERGARRRLLRRTLHEFEMRGQGLSFGSRESFVQLEKRLTELKLQYLNNLNDASAGHVEFSKDELRGLPEKRMASLSLSPEGKVQVPLLDSMAGVVLQTVEKEDVRRRYYVARSSRAAETNLPLVGEILRDRALEASFLGYPNYAALVEKDRMARHPSEVKTFLKQLRQRIEPKLKEELDTLFALKRELNPDLVSEGEGIHAWDWTYLNNIQKKRMFQFDPQTIEEYFPADQTISRIFGIFQRLFGVQLEEIRGAPVWHPFVRLFSVKDGKSGEVLGFFYTDLYRRDGKITKTATSHGFVPGRRLPDGTFQRPSAVLLANFPGASQDRPALLSLEGGVGTLLHEFGHVMHFVLARSEYGGLSSYDVPWDFVEIPSSTLANWIWDPKVLKELSGHYQNSDRKLPDDLIRRMVASRTVDIGAQKAWQLVYATVDQIYHTAQYPMDTTEIWRETQHDILKLDLPEGTHPEASFQHIFSGSYDAGYYGYLWSEVIAADLFTKFKKNGVLNPATGMAFRTRVLEPGASRSVSGMIRSFLGRQWNSKAFLSMFDSNNQAAKD